MNNILHKEIVEKTEKLLPVNYYLPRESVHVPETPIAVLYWLY